MDLSDKQKARYARTIALPEVGLEGQAKLCEGSVLIVGAGGLGSPAALYLAATGVGTVGIVDSDRVSLDNLQRQVLHRTKDIGRPKTDSARDTLNALNPDITVKTYDERFTSANATALLAEYDFVIDATDNFVSKFLIADACHFASRPYSHAGVRECGGQTMTVLPGHTACYRCVFDSTPPDDRDTSLDPPGILGVVPGVLGALQAVEAVKFLLSAGRLLVNALLIFDALDVAFRTVTTGRNLDCPLCGKAPTITELR